MNKVLLDRTPLWEIRPEEQTIPDINSLQVDNAREQAKLYYEANKEEILINTLREKDKEIERLQNIIKEAREYIKEHLEREYFDDDILEVNTIYNRDLFKVLKMLDKEK